MAKYKKNYVFKERIYAEELLEKGFPDKIINYGDMGILSKYFREVEGLGEKKIEKRIIAFCLSQNKEFNPILEVGYIKKWVKFGMENSLRNIEHVVITKSEMNTIKTVKDLKYRKVLFAMLVFSKASKLGATKIKHEESKSDKYFINSIRFSNVIELLDFRITFDQFIKILGEFNDLGLITLYSPDINFNVSCLLNFVNNNGSMALIIKEIKQSMEYYKTYFGGVSGYCADCGREIVKKSNSQVRCESCSIERKKERIRNRVGKFRKKEISNE